MTFPPVPKRIPLYLDMEFTGLVPRTTPISLAIVLSETHYFYAEFTDFNTLMIDAWLRDNVLANCTFLDIDGNFKPKFGIYYCTHDDNEFEVRDLVRRTCGPTTYVVKQLNDWLSYTALTHRTPPLSVSTNMFTIVSDCCMYDMVLFNNLFGGSFKVPKCINYIPLDICTMFVDMDIDPDISRREFLGTTYTDHHRHNALDDALEIKACHEKLMLMKKERV